MGMSLKYDKRQSAGSTRDCCLVHDFPDLLVILRTCGTRIGSARDNNVRLYLEINDASIYHLRNVIVYNLPLAAYRD